MKLVFIYGPPATGKLTVAKELSKITGYKIFHNHLTVDLLTSILEFGKGDFFKLSNKIRLDVFKSAAKNNINLIFTFCFAKDEDEHYVNRTVKAIKKYKGKACFVRLYCDEKLLFKRVKSASRENFDKLKSKKLLKKFLAEHDLFSKIPYKKSLEIDNTNKSAKKVAMLIKDYYKL